MFRVTSILNNKVESRVFNSTTTMKAYINRMLLNNAYIELSRI